MKHSFFTLLLLLSFVALPSMAQEHEEEGENPWNIELSSTVPIAKGLEQTTTLHLGREVHEHIDIGIFGAWVGKDWSDKKEQFYGFDTKYFFKEFSTDDNTNFYVSLGIAYNTELENDERINSIRYGWKLGIDQRLFGEVSIFAETGQDLLYTPDTETYSDDLSGLLLIGLKYDF